MKVDTLLKVIPLNVGIVMSWKYTSVLCEVHPPRNLNISKAYGECYVESILPVNTTTIQINI